MAAGELPPPWIILDVLADVVDCSMVSLLGGIAVPALVDKHVGSLVRVGRTPWSAPIMWAPAHIAVGLEAGDPQCLLKRPERCA